MSLSNILLKHVPRYGLNIPSTKEQVWFRPLLVKEEKKLLQINEFGTQKEKINALVEVLESCFEYDKIRELTIVDIQYLFIQLRIKSIGSTVTPIFVCPTTQEKIKLHINLAEVEVTSDPTHTNIIEFPNVQIRMKHPTISTMIDYDTLQTNDDEIYNLALSCIVEIQTIDELIDCSKHTKKELEEFLNTMTKEQFNKILSFFETMPKIEKSVTYTTSDNVSRTIILKGISDFFG